LPDRGCTPAESLTSVCNTHGKTPATRDLHARFASSNWGWLIVVDRTFATRCPCIDSTTRGCTHRAASPCPSCPNVPTPQLYSLPSTSTAHMWSQPSDISETLALISATWRGTVCFCSTGKSVSSTHGVTQAPPHLRVGVLKRVAEVGGVGPVTNSRGRQRCVSSAARGGRAHTYRPQVYNAPEPVQHNHSTNQH
jgi:hypothetical protein